MPDASMTEIKWRKDGESLHIELNPCNANTLQELIHWIEAHQDGEFPPRNDPIVINLSSIDAPDQ